jgi:hypothetical protein
MSSIFGRVIICFHLNCQIKVYTALIVPYVKLLIFPDARTHKFEYHSAFFMFAPCISSIKNTIYYSN